jgi:hypothetical protein
MNEDLGLNGHKFRWREVLAISNEDASSEK